MVAGPAVAVNFMWTEVPLVGYIEKGWLRRGITTLPVGTRDDGAGRDQGRFGPNVGRTGERVPWGKSERYPNMTGRARRWQVWWRRSGTWFVFGASLTAAVVAGWFWWDYQRHPVRWAWPEVFHAAATHGGQSMALATGSVDEGEGLFVLDYLTGDLHCFVIYPRFATKFLAHYQTNVIQVLGVQPGKKPDYLMVTGQMEFRQGTALNRPAGTVVYVADANTGKFAAFGVPWNRQAANVGQPQQGPLVLLDVGQARAVELERAAP